MKPGQQARAKYKLSERQESEEEELECHSCHLTLRTHKWTLLSIIAIVLQSPFVYYCRYETKNEFHYCHPCHQQLFSSPRRSGDAGNEDTQNDDDSDGDRTEDATGNQCHEVLGNGDRSVEPDMSAMMQCFECFEIMEDFLVFLNCGVQFLVTLSVHS